MFVLVIVECKPCGSGRTIKAANILFPLGKSRGKRKGKGMGFARKLVLGLAFKQEKNATMGTRVKTKEGV